MSRIDWLDLLRFEAGELDPKQTADLEQRLAKDPPSVEDLEWLRALRRAEASGWLQPEGAAEDVDPMAVAALAEGRLDEAEAQRVRQQLLLVPDGLGMLEAALEELEAPAPLRALPAPAPGGSSWRPILLAAAALLVVTMAALYLRAVGGSTGDPAPQWVAQREAMPVPTLRSDAVLEGLSAYGEGRYEDAVQLLQPALAAEPEQGLGWLYLGSAQLLLGRDAEARESLTRAVQHSSGSIEVEARWQLAQAEIALGNTQAAQQLLTELQGTRRGAEAQQSLDQSGLPIRTKADQ